MILRSPSGSIGIDAASAVDMLSTSITATSYLDSFLNGNDIVVNTFLHSFVSAGGHTNVSSQNITNIVAINGDITLVSESVGGHTALLGETVSIRSLDNDVIINAAETQLLEAPAVEIGSDQIKLDTNAVFIASGAKTYVHGDTGIFMSAATQLTIDTTTDIIAYAGADANIVGNGVRASSLDLQIQTPFVSTWSSRGRTHLSASARILVEKCNGYRSCF